ncbi:MAG: hypothetical protein GC160_16400 [Acidobacteria bacterium]|nr:hypothetical protein [Acidobacteriota bacterium]
MDLETDFEQQGDLLLASVWGEWSLPGMRRLVDAIGVECAARGCRRVLLDGLAIEVPGAVFEFERYLLGERIARKLQGLRLAVLFPGDHINKFAESVANRGGAAMLVTHDRDAAEAFLAHDEA